MDGIDAPCCCSGLASTPLNGLRVLIVDDDPDTVFLFSLTFEQMGSVILVATSVDEALHTLECHRPSMLLSDIQLPEKNGYALIRTVRSREVGGKVKLPAIDISAHAREDDQRTAIEAGFDRDLTKPVNLDTLVSTATELAERRMS